MKATQKLNACGGGASSLGETNEYLLELHLKLFWAPSFLSIIYSLTFLRVRSSVFCVKAHLFYIELLSKYSFRRKLRKRHKSNGQQTTSRWVWAFGAVWCSWLTKGFVRLVQSVVIQIGIISMTPPRVFQRRRRGGNGVMVWTWFAVNNLGPLLFISGVQTSGSYCALLEQSFLPSANNKFAGNWLF